MEEIKWIPQWIEVETDCATLLSRALNIEVLFCRTSYTLPPLLAMLSSCLRMTIQNTSHGYGSVLPVFKMAFVCWEKFFFYTFNSFWKHVIHYCSIIPFIVPSPSSLFAVNFHMSTNSIVKVDLEVDRNLYSIHDTIFIIFQMKLHALKVVGTCKIVDKDTDWKASNALLAEAWLIVGFLVTKQTTSSLRSYLCGQTETISIHEFLLFMFPIRDLLKVKLSNKIRKAYFSWK